MRLRYFVILALFFIALPAHAAPATAGLEVSGWLPYWKTASSTADALAHLGAFKEINPFSYSVTSDGLILDTAEIVNGAWDELINAAHARKIRVIPTLMWSDGEAMHRILSNQEKRIALEDAIAYLVKAKGFDGIDIDFEGKYAETRDYFSTFLKGLYWRMGNKWVMCDIEPRTPLSSLYEGTPPPGAGDYANDYKEIAKYCDRVRIMGYDQGSADVKLNAAAGGKPYVPVADPAWVTKVVNLVAKDIPKRKLVLGIPTYGYEYSVTPLLPGGYYYDLQWAFNPQYALDLAATYGMVPLRNSAGELSFVYIPGLNTNPNLNTELPAVSNHMLAEAAAISGSKPIFNIVWWSDARAINDKINIAKDLGLRGIAIFKIDGGEDPGLWELLE